MRIIRLLLVVMTLSILTDTHAARMSDYADNTTPNADVYFIGVDPNDTSQTVRGSNYRYSLASILGNGLLDATFKSLTVSGAGDSWLELENNTSFTDSLTGKYGIRFYNGVLQQIINGTASAIGSGGSAPTLQADDPDMSDATGWYLATGSGDLFYVNSGIGMWTFTGTYSGDVIDPVIGAVTPSALTHDGTGATLSATIASVTEANEDYRQWSLYDVTDAAIQTDWTTFTGLSISGVTIPADQHTYRIDVLVTDLAGNTGTASSANIAYEAIAPDPAIQYNLEDNAATSTVVASFGSNAALRVSGSLTNTSTVANSGAIEGTSCFKLPAASAVFGDFGTTDADGVFTVDFYVYGDGGGSSSANAYILGTSTSNLSVIRYSSDTTLRVYCSTVNLSGGFTIDDIANGYWQNFRLVFDAGASGDDFELYQRSHNGTTWGSWSLKGSAATFTTPAISTFAYGCNTDNNNGWGSNTNDYRIDQIRIWDSAVRP